MNADAKMRLVVTGLSVGCAGLAGAFLLNVWGHPQSLAVNAPVDPAFTNTATVRMSGAELDRTGGDTSGFGCYTCHDKKKPIVLNFDAEKNIVLSEAHKDLTLKHGRHNRNNICFNCHDESNLERLQTRDGRELKIMDSSPLCGSCHGPTFRDWEAGAHGRISGFWARNVGAIQRQDCVSCHDPHSPKFPPQKPAPRPNPLRPVDGKIAPSDKGH